MKNFNENLDELNFHDSDIKSVCLTEDGILRVKIHYYNWEGNKFESQKWISKKLLLEVEHCIHLRYSSPGLSNEDLEIQKHESLEKHSELIEQLDNYQAKRQFKFNNTIAVRFLTHSYGEPVFDESIGFLEIAGFNAKLIWSEAEEEGKPFHIPAGK